MLWVKPKKINNSRFQQSVANQKKKHYDDNLKDPFQKREVITEVASIFGKSRQKKRTAQKKRKGMLSLNTGLKQLKDYRKKSSEPGRRERIRSKGGALPEGESA